jgi:hypothetical protein
VAEVQSERSRQQRNEARAAKPKYTYKTKKGTKKKKK